MPAVTESPITAILRSPLKLNEDFITCLNDEPGALKRFYSLAGSHRNYFSKWIDGAKTEQTKAKRITMAVSALLKGFGFSEMMLEQKAKKDV